MRPNHTTALLSGWSERMLGTLDSVGKRRPDERRSLATRQRRGTGGFAGSLLAGSLLAASLVATSLVATSLLGAAPARAQTASQVTPPSFRPNQNSVGGALVFSGQPGLGTPAGAERLSVRLSGVTVENLPPDFAGEARALEDRLVGRRLPASEIFAAARDLEAAFVRTGAILVRVVLPAQTLKDGNRLRLVVVNGFVERIDTSRLPEATRGRIEAVIAPLHGRRDLQLGEIERRLLLAGDTPGVALRSTLQPSGAAGGTTLIVEAAYRPVTGYVGGDNTVGLALGGFSVGGGFDVNTVFGQGETLYVRTLGHPTGDRADGIGGLFSDNPTLRTLSGGFVLPLGTDGLTLNVEATSSRTAPKLRNLVQTTSEYDRLSFRLRYPVLRSRAGSVFTEIAFDATREKLGLALPGVIAPLSLDELRVLRVSADGDLRVATGGLFAARGTASFGLDALGARSRADATPLLPLSRFGADAAFQKVDLAVSFNQPLAESLVLGLYARGQTAFGQTLARSEQIGTASFQELSTFDAGSLGGDSGWIVRSELAAPVTLTPDGVPLTIAPYLFGATGALYLARPTTVEVGTLHVSSVGVGVRLAAPLGPDGPLASLTLEFGRRFRDDSIPDANRFTVLGSVRF